MQPDLLQAFARGFIEVFIWPTLGYMLLGIAIGFIVGILPGLGGVVSLAIILPFTFDLRPAEAFALLLAMATVASNTSDFTSILFGVPGDASSAALVVDGYPMTKKGEAGRALAANLLASLFGAAIGAFAIVAAIPIVRPLVLSFGSAEFFMLCLLGITFVASLSTGAAIKGLLSGLLGLFISLVGMEPQTLVERYTFGLLQLWDGVGLVPVAIGLFAIPELYDLSVRRTSIAHAMHTRITGVWQGVKDCFTHFWLIVRCSLIGTFVGIIPGLGAPVAQWVSYGHAVQSSPNKERFGRGAVEGTLGPGAANNSGLGGSLIPLVAFGVPGSLIAAILLGAFLIQGLQPGPAMLTTHLSLTMEFVWIIVIANVIVTILCFPILGQLAKITFLRGPLVLPIILLLVFIGSFAFRNRMEDLLVTIAFGALGLTMVRLGWPRPPLILGLVLGALAENYLFTAYARWELAFLTRPLVLVLMAIMALALAYPVVERRLRRAATAHGIAVPVQPIPGGENSSQLPQPEPSREEGAQDNVQPSEMVRTGFWDRVTSPNLIFTLVLVLMAAAGVWEAKDWHPHARLFPWVVGFPLVGLAAVYLMLQLTGLAKESRAQMELASIGMDVDPATIKRRSAEFVAWLVAFIGGLWMLGFVIGGPLLTLTYMKLVGREKWPIALTLTGLVAVTIWTMRNVLHLPFHGGVVWRLFGI